MSESKDNLALRVSQKEGETPEQAMARARVMPENLAASMLVCTKLVDAPVTDLARELRQQTAAINSGDLTRAENMLMAQAHTLDALFANLTARAMNAKHMDNLEAFMRLAFKAQNQARATLQTLGELKAPKHVAFVKQANIGQNVQVNNGTTGQPTRTRKAKKAQNELLEVEHGERLDARAAGTAGGVDPAMATVGEQHRPMHSRG
ncbi:hypothetical protein [Azotobacter armeniacus]